MAKHAKLSPSAAYRWMNCPGSIALCETVPPRPESIYAKEGTAAHALAEMCLKNNIDPFTVNHVIVEGEQRYNVNEEMAEAVLLYLKTINEIKDQYANAESFIETKLNLNAWVPGCWGTADFLLVVPKDRVVVVDYKHGAGVAVDANSPQLKIYALGAVGVTNPNQVKYAEVKIVQPRAQHSEGPVRSVVYKVEDLLEWGRTVLKPKAKEAMKPNAERKPGSWCRWCDALDVCPEARKGALAVAKIMFDEKGIPQEPQPVLPPVEDLTPEELAKIHRIAKNFLTPWVKAVENRLREILATKGPTAGLKLVAGRATRKWADEAEAEKTLTDLLGEDAYDVKLVSPAKAEKALKKIGYGKEVLDGLIEVSHSISIAPIDDKRPAIETKAERMFPTDNE